MSCMLVSESSIGHIGHEGYLLYFPRRNVEENDFSTDISPIYEFKVHM